MIHVDFYTDPLCCWSWAMQKEWLRFVDHYKDVISFRYRMCGMIRDWKTYNDPMNAIQTPFQMAPLWMHAEKLTGVKMNYEIWSGDESPASSYPACMAVKTAALQSSNAEAGYFHFITSAMMEGGKNISRADVLLSLAHEFTTDDFDVEKFEEDFIQNRGSALFRDDLIKAKLHGIGRYPTLTFHNAEGEGFMIVGYRPFHDLQLAFETQCADVLKC